MSKIHTPTTIHTFINLFNRQVQTTQNSHFNEKGAGFKVLAIAPRVFRSSY